MNGWPTGTIGRLKGTYVDEAALPSEKSLYRYATFNQMKAQLFKSAGVRTPRTWTRLNDELSSNWDSFWRKRCDKAALHYPGISVYAAAPVDGRSPLEACAGSAAECFASLGLAPQPAERFELKYKAKAVGNKPDKHEALSNWGNALTGLAKLKRGDEADTLYRNAYSKYEAAIAIKPDEHEVLDNWAFSLVHLFHRSGSTEATSLLAEALDKATKANALHPGAGAYNAACACSLLDRPDEARAWLQRSRDAGELPDLDHLESDTDLANLRDLDWFQDLLSDLRSA